MPSGGRVRGRVAWERLLPLAAAGALMGHSIAYRLVPGGHARGPGSVHVHGYLAAAVPIVVAAAAVGVCVSLIESGGRPPGVVPLRLLFGLQVALFVLQEFAERLAYGFPGGSLLSAPALWVGVGAQVLVAGALLRLVRGMQRAVRSIRLAGEMMRVRPGGVLAPVAVAFRGDALRHHLIRRGPPETS